MNECIVTYLVIILKLVLRTNIFGGTGLSIHSINEFHCVLGIDVIKLILYLLW